MVAIVEVQDGVVSVGGQQRRVVAGVEPLDVAGELDEQELREQRACGKRENRP
jgi:hypothetical protein